MLELSWQRLEGRIKKPGEVGMLEMLEWVYYVKPEDPLQIHVPQGDLRTTTS